MAPKGTVKAPNKKKSLVNGWMLKFARRVPCCNPISCTKLDGTFSRGFFGTPHLLGIQSPPENGNGTSQKL